MIFMIFNINEVVRPQCENKDHCIVFGLRDECGPCPHYDEIREVFFSDSCRGKECEFFYMDSSLCKDCDLL